MSVLLIEMMKRLLDCLCVGMLVCWYVGKANYFQVNNPTSQKI